MTEVLILIFGLVLLTLALGLPLLVSADSIIPDIVAAGILTIFVLAFVWGSEAYWVFLPILAVVAFVAWLDREREEVTIGIRPDNQSGMSDRTRSRLRLWQAAHRVAMGLVAVAVISMAAGFGAYSMQFVVPWIVIMGVAMAAFRFSFYRSSERDQRASMGETKPLEATEQA